MKSTQPTSLFEITPRQAFEGTLVVLAVLLGFWLLYLGRTVIFSLFTAIVISTAIAPAVAWLGRRRVPAGVSVVLIYLAFVAALAGVGFLFVPLLTVQGAHIASTFGDLYTRLLSTLRQAPSYLLQRLASELPANLALPAATGPTGKLDALLGGLVYLGLVGDGLVIVVAVMLLAFYWTLDRDRLLRWLLLFVPVTGRDQARELFLASEQKVGGYIRGVALLSLIVGALSFGAYLLMGLPFALLLGITSGLLEAVPVIGPALGSIPALTIALAVNPSLIIWVALAHALIQVLENYVLAPRVMRQTVGVNPVVTLLSLLAFGSLFGLPGALMAIPIAAVVQLVLDRLVLRPEVTAAQPPAGRDNLSVLRLDAQELMRDVRNQWRQQSETPTVNQPSGIEETVEALAAEVDALLAGASAAASAPGKQSPVTGAPANNRARSGA